MSTEAQCILAWGTEYEVQPVQVAREMGVILSQGERFLILSRRELLTEPLRGF